jgi:hypothetical protein
MMNRCLSDGGKPMTKQICVTFYKRLGDRYVDEQVNEYLANHPTHRIQLIDYSMGNTPVREESVFIVFETEVVD